MKKGMTILIAAILIFSIFGTAAAVDLVIERELMIEGEGSLDVVLKVQSEKGFAGQKLEDTLYTRWMGINGDSVISYKSDLEMYLFNLTGENRTAEISYAQEAEATKVKQSVFSGDYPLGASVGFYSKGDHTKSFELYTDPDVSAFEMEGYIEGRLKLMQKVVDPFNRTVYLRDVSQIDGKYAYTHSAYVELSGYPAGGCEDYLGCP